MRIFYVEWLSCGAFGSETFSQTVYKEACIKTISSLRSKPNRDSYSCFADELN